LPRTADVVVIEGTYSNRNHKDMGASVQELQQAIVQTAKRKGNVLIPSFAIERAQDILYFLRELYYRKMLPRYSVFLDSPMGISVTNVMRRYPEYFDKEASDILKKNRDPFIFPGVQFTKTQNASRQINYIKKNAIIIAGSGMCTGGRIKHHLTRNIANKKSSIIFIGYQAQGTLGRKIVDKSKRVKIFGRDFSVNAEVYTIGGFSAHADRDILCDWLEHTGRPEHLFLVHGEKKALLSFQKGLTARNQAKNIHVPGYNSRYSL
jgi:metallo-beta-lactamase family protein